MKTLIVIPARAASTRLPGKMLLAETGKPLIQHTYQTAESSSLADRIVVATDSTEILAAVRQFGGEGILTSVDHVSGTDRVAEVADQFPEFDLIVNLQGDEPELPGSWIDAAVSLLIKGHNIQMGTLAVPICDRDRIESPDCVKVVIDDQGRALYFSRALIPFPRNEIAIDKELKTRGSFSYLQHIGLYVYRRDLLQKVVRMPPAPLEIIESLEQLRVLQAGIPIHVAVVEGGSAPPKGIDTAADYAAFVRRQHSG